MSSTEQMNKKTYCKVHIGVDEKYPCYMCEFENENQRESDRRDRHRHLEYRGKIDFRILSLADRMSVDRREGVRIPNKIKIGYGDKSDQTWFWNKVLEAYDIK
jgi:hypothetical protein